MTTHRIENVAMKRLTSSRALLTAFVACECGLIPPLFRNLAPKQNAPDFCKPWGVLNSPPPKSAPDQPKWLAERLGMAPTGLRPASGWFREPSPGHTALSPLTETATRA